MFSINNNGRSQEGIVAMMITNPIKHSHQQAFRQNASEFFFGFIMQ